MEVGETPRDADKDVATPSVPPQAPLAAALTLYYVSLQCAAQIAARHILPLHTCIPGFGTRVHVTQHWMCPTKNGRLSLLGLVEGRVSTKPTKPIDYPVALETLLLQAGSICT